MPESTSILSSGATARVNLKPYSAELPLGTLAVGVDNIHHDVFLSPKFVEATETYLLEFIRQTVNLPFLAKTDRSQQERRLYARRDNDRKPARAPEAVSWKRQLSELLHSGLQQAKFGQNIEIDLLLRAALAEIPDAGDRHAVRQPHARSQGVDPHPRRAFRPHRTGAS
jgi:hypothetical protein